MRLIECGAALDAGFDSLNFAEHHYSPKQLTPNPIIFAAVAGRRFPDAQIGVFGTDLPLNNPVRIAEEYSMLDNLLDGRLRIGMLRGTPNEYLTYGSNPWESARALRGGDAAAEGLLHRTGAVRMGGSLLPLPQHRRVAAAGAGSAPADPHLRQQQGRCDLRRPPRTRPRLLVHGGREVRRARRAVSPSRPPRRVGNRPPTTCSTATSCTSRRPTRRRTRRWRRWERRRVDEPVQRSVARHHDDDGADRRSAGRRAQACEDRPVDGAADDDGPAAVRQPGDRARSHQGDPRRARHGPPRGVARAPSTRCRTMRCCRA